MGECDTMCKISLVPTGSIAKEYLDEYGITEKELAKQFDINRLTEEFACKLEKVLTGVPASYWLNYEAKYRIYEKRLCLVFVGGAGNPFFLLFF